MTRDFSQTIKIYPFILLSFAIALVLLLLRSPFDIAPWLQPLWLIIALLYWTLMAPQHINVGAAWLIGLMLDIMYNAPIGENCFALVLICFLATKFRHKIIPLGFWKSSLAIFGLIFIYQLVKFLMQLFINDYFNIWSIPGNAGTSALVWAPLAFLLFKYQTKLRS